MDTTAENEQDDKAYTTTLARHRQGPITTTTAAERERIYCKNHYLNSKSTGHIRSEYRKLGKDKEGSKQKEGKGKRRITELVAASGAEVSSGTVSTPHSPISTPPFTCGTSALCCVTSYPPSTYTPSTGWTYGLGASSHMTSNLDIVVNIRYFDEKDWLCKWRDLTPHWSWHCGGPGEAALPL